MEKQQGVGWILVKSTFYGLVGLVAVPVLLFLVVIVLGRVLDPRCGTPGDSGGCEMGAAGIAFASAIPAFALFFLVALVLAIRRRGRGQPPSGFEAALKQAEERHD